MMIKSLKSKKHNWDVLIIHSKMYKCTYDAFFSLENISLNSNDFFFVSLIIS